MKTYTPAELRNFAVVGHAASGKTVLCDAMLFNCGVINRIGTIAEGSTTSDYHPIEKERGNSVHATPLHAEWEGRKLNLIDTPGYLDFNAEALGCMIACDFAMIVVSAHDGVQVGSDIVWDFATRFEIPKLIVLNHMDYEEANFDAVVAEIKEHFGERVFPVTLPQNPGEGFNQVLDVVERKIVTYQTDGSGKSEETDPAGDLKTLADEEHARFIECVAESDESLIEKFFDQGSLSDDEMHGGMHRGFQEQSYIPLFVTSATTNVGVTAVLDFVAKFGSSPIDRKTVTAKDSDGADVKVSIDDDQPSALVFKMIHEDQVGELSLFRVYSGKIKTGDELQNAATGHSERIGQMYMLNGKLRDSVDSFGAGDIGAVVKLKHTHTGNSLCSPNRVVRLPEVEYPQPNIHSAIRSKSRGDEDKVAAGLAMLHEEDPTFVHHVDSELHQTVISGQGELHMQVICDQLKRRFKVEIDLIEPKIPYRETIKSTGESKYRHKKQSGGAGQFAEVWMRIEPKERDSGVEFTESLVGQNVDRVFVPSVHKGVDAACAEGILAGYRVVDVKIDFYDGKMHPVDSKDVAFQIAGKQAFREAFMQAKPILLEPICEITVRIPEAFMGNVMGDISSRQGKILGMDTEGKLQILKAHVPQRQLFHYSTVLRSLTGGRGLHSEAFSHYEEMPHDIAKKIIEESGHKPSEE